MRIDGTWQLNYELGGGLREGTVRITAAGRSFGGVWNDGESSTTFDGGRVEDGKVTWALQSAGSSGPVTVLFEGLVEGNGIAGTVELEDREGGGLFSGRRIG